MRVATKTPPADRAEKNIVNPDSRKFFYNKSKQLQPSNSTGAVENNVSRYLLEKGELEASKGLKDPYLRLAAAIFIAAIRDLKKRDPVVFLDALVWLVFGDGLLWLRLLDFELDSQDLLKAIGRGSIYANRTHNSGRPATEGAPGNEC